MSSYYPDKWEVIELKSLKGTVRKVLASWYGGFVGSNTWKLSSVIERVVQSETGFEFHNASGSVYYCHKEAQGMSSYTFSVYSSWLQEAEKDVLNEHEIKIVENVLDMLV